MVSRPAVASSATGQSGARGSTSVSGPGQKRSEPLGGGIEPREPARAGNVAHVRDQRIERGPALGGIEARHRLAVGRIGAEPIDGLGREGDEPAGRKAARRRSNGLSAGRQHARHRLGGHLYLLCLRVPGRRRYKSGHSVGV